MDPKNYYFLNSNNNTRHAVTVEYLATTNNLGSLELYRDLGAAIQPIYCGTVINYFSAGDVLTIRLYKYDTEDDEWYTFNVVE